MFEQKRRVRKAKSQTRWRAGSNFRWIGGCPAMALNFVFGEQDLIHDGLHNLPSNRCRLSRDRHGAMGHLSMWSKDDQSHVSRVTLVSLPKGPSRPSLLTTCDDSLETAKGRNIAAERMRRAANADTTCTHLKIVDQESGKIVGQGKWYIRETDPEPAKMTGKYWIDEEHRQFTESLVHVYFDRRRRAINEIDGRVYCAFRVKSIPCHSEG